MIEKVTLPSFGSSMGEATIVEWLVKVGETVEQGQVIAEVETDKAMADLEAPANGTLASIEVAAGSENIETGAILATIQLSGDQAPEERLEAGEQDQPAAHDESPAESKHSAQASPEQSAAPNVSTVPHKGERTMVSPFARKLAAESGIDLNDVDGSGPGGRIISRDLARTGQASGHRGLSELEELGYVAGSYEVIPITKMRRAIAAGLTQSVQQIPQYSLSFDIPMDTALERRKEHNDSNQDTPLSINDLFVWGCSRALMEVPAVNASWTETGIAQHGHAQIAIAVAIEDGLVAPVIRQAEQLSVSEIAAASRELAMRAGNGGLKSADLQGATFTVSNLGMTGVVSFNSILSKPQAAILSVGAVRQQPRSSDGKVVFAQTARVTLTCDHRVIDGMTGSRFLQALANALSLAEF